MVDDRRLLVERARRCDDGEVPSGTVAVRDGEVVLGVSKGAIVLDRVRPASGKSMSAMAWWVGARFEHDAPRWT
jgi:methionyl-tRNA formyltransferase